MSVDLEIDVPRRNRSVFERAMAWVLTGIIGAMGIAVGMLVFAGFMLTPQSIKPLRHLALEQGCLVGGTYVKSVWRLSTQERQDYCLSEDGRKRFDNGDASEVLALRKAYEVDLAADYRACRELTGFKGQLVRLVNFDSVENVCGRPPDTWIFRW